MRSIKKQGAGGYYLQKQHKNPPSSSQDATTRWKNFRGQQGVQDALCTEQYQLCCYSELRADEMGFDYHIEHVENKSLNPSRTFDYTNLAASALSATDLQKFKGNEIFGGHSRGKQSNVDLKRFVSPHQTNCANFFAYLSDGRIVPKLSLSEGDTHNASYTIDLLNLNSPYLVNLRKRLWDELVKLFEEHTTKHWELNDLISIELRPDHQRLNSFFTLRRQFFGPRAEQVLKNHTPELV